MNAWPFPRLEDMPRRFRLVMPPAIGGWVDVTLYDPELPENAIRCFHKQCWACLEDHNDVPAVALLDDGQVWPCCWMHLLYSIDFYLHDELNGGAHVEIARQTR